jgi:hypothetical protein
MPIPPRKGLQGKSAINIPVWTILAPDMEPVPAQAGNAGIGKWLSVDPLAEKYYQNGGLVYFSNNPINAFDPDGQLERDSKDNLVFNSKRFLPRTHAKGSIFELTVIYNAGYLFTEEGNEIVAYSNLPGNTDKMDTNCHGWTFGDEKYWIDDNQVQTILNDEYDNVETINDV